ncbi:MULTISPECIES: SRPBCC family protein [unclassified Pseudofrankia]|uniref:SRPBCC family protein n=1 Tax=unclassified Pseudofrankia TaxID=2994372 RepID=UPI0008D9FD29|nr:MULTISPECIES: SRPBCC family protein [unclassified Pseudofrankia]MDT3440946.1 SRPBCC family protein [Pseudofrankia sp. BMG5.37]OHV45505.1 polyketide cyclase [Pseudofrankia sp. BMG5.36]
MWSYEHSVATTAEAGAVWRLWVDVAGWGAWNADIEQIEVSGPFAVGSEIVMNPHGENPVRLRLAEVAEPERFVDEADLGDVLVRTTHRVDPVDGERNRVTYRMEISGPAADELGPRVGPMITADFPETIAALVRLAESTEPAAARFDAP